MKISSDLWYLIKSSYCSSRLIYWHKPCFWLLLIFLENQRGVVLLHNSTTVITGSEAEVGVAACLSVTCLYLSNDTASLIHLLQSLSPTGADKRAHSHTPTDTKSFCLKQKPRAAGAVHCTFFIEVLQKRSSVSCWYHSMQKEKKSLTSLPTGSEWELNLLTTTSLHKRNMNKKKGLWQQQGNHCFNSQQSGRVYKATFKPNGLYDGIMTIT